MTTLDAILSKLRDTDATIWKLSNLAAEFPRDRVIGINIDAVTRRRRFLEQQLRAALKASQTDLVEYRLDPRSGPRCPATGVVESIAAFQALLSDAFSALSPDTAAGDSGQPESAELAMLGLIGGERGSATVTLSLLNDRLLAVPSVVEEALAGVLAMLEAETAVGLRNLAQHLGIASIAAARKWADASVRHDLGVALRWQKAGEAERTLQMPVSRAWILRNMIDKIEDETVDTVECDCQLLGLDHFTGEFRLAGDNGSLITGRLAAKFSDDVALSLRGTYRATLSRTTTIRYATAAQTESWELLALATKPNAWPKRPSGPQLPDQVSATFARPRPR